jgi:hypothetical protein
MKPECKIDSIGNKRWWLNGVYHREDGPALEFADGEKMWLINGVYHREDGPAVEFSDGNKQWWLNDRRYTEQEYYKELYKLGKISYDDYILEMI